MSEPQAHAGVRVLRSELEAAVQEIYALIELAEVHIEETQVIEEIGIFGVLAEEFLQVDACLVELDGGEELVGAGEGVGSGIADVNDKP